MKSHFTVKSIRLRTFLILFIKYNIIEIISFRLRTQYFFMKGLHHVLTVPVVGLICVFLGIGRKGRCLLRPVQFDRKSHRKIGNRKSNFTDLDEKIFMYG
jgi:hypothetical protein